LRVPRFAPRLDDHVVNSKSKCSRRVVNFSELTHENPQRDALADASGGGKNRFLTSPVIALYESRVGSLYGAGCSVIAERHRGRNTTRILAASSRGLHPRPGQEALLRPRLPGVRRVLQPVGLHDGDGRNPRGEARPYIWVRRVVARANP